MGGSIHHSGFETRAYDSGRRKYTQRYFSRTQRIRYSDYNKQDSSGSMLAKMGICALLTGLVVLSEFLGSEDRIIETSSQIGQGDETGGDYLGKLRFVELPGIIQVFSSDAKFRMGVEFKDWQLNDDKTSMTVTGIDGELPAPADGTIKNVSIQENNTIVELYADGDIVIGFNTDGTVTVEQGQPVKAGDTLFKDVSKAEISIAKGGRPVDPSEYYTMENEMFS